LKKRPNMTMIGTLTAIVVMAAVAVLAFFSIDGFYKSTDGKSLTVLEDAIKKAAVQCYAIEGSYPPDLQYLADHYGIILNEENYIYHYQVFGSNVMPEIIVLEKWTGGSNLICLHTKNNDRGYAMIELVLVIALLALFGVATLSLAVSGSAAYENINEKKELNSELRVALSYLDAKVRQNDTEGALRLESNPAGDGPALVVSETIGQVQYETWIYLSGGNLKEVLIEKGEPVLDDLGFDIAEIDGFTAKFDHDKMLLHLNVWINKGDGSQSMGTDIFIKSGLGVTQ